MDTVLGRRYTIGIPWFRTDILWDPGPGNNSHQLGYSSKPVARKESRKAEKSFKIRIGESKNIKVA